MVYGVFPSQIHSKDGFGPAALGGVINVLFYTFNATDTGIASGVKAFTIPNNAEIIAFCLNVPTAFDGTVANTIDIGTSGTAQQFAAAINAAITGQLWTGFIASQLFSRFTENTDLYVKYNGTAPSNGQATICMYYISRSK